MEERITEEEFRRLLAAARGQQPRRSSGFVRFLGDVCQMVLVAVAIVGGYFLISIFVGEPAALPPPPTNAQPPVVQRPAPQAQPGTTYGVNSLPSCADVTDTRTACQPDGPQAAPAAVEQLPTEAPPPTAEPTPAWETACETVPGERPCWLPADQEWTPPETVPETPIVYVPDATDTPLIFMDAACANWHPPLALPEGCKHE